MNIFFFFSINTQRPADKLHEEPIAEILERLHEVPSEYRTAIRNHGGGWEYKCIQYLVHYPFTSLKAPFSLAEVGGAFTVHHPRKRILPEHVFWVMCSRIHPSEELYPMSCACGIQHLRGMYFVAHDAKSICNGMVHSNKYVCCV